MPQIPSPFATFRAVFRGYLPRVLQARGWTLAAVTLAPMLLALAASIVIRMKAEHFPPAFAIYIFHGVLVAYVLPIAVLVAAPAGIREDLEQRTLPLLLIRPATVWALPLAKGALWFAWVALWLLLATTLLLPMELAPEALPRMALAMVLALWGELSLMTLMGLVFRWGTLWGALYLLVGEQMTPVLPGALQRLTFTYHIQNLAGSRVIRAGARNLLAQDPIATPAWVSALALLGVGILCWALCGWKLHRSAIGLTGKDAEG